MAVTSTSDMLNESPKIPVTAAPVPVAGAADGAAPAAAGGVIPAAGEAPAVVDAVLIEALSIDGMCGVY